MVGLRRDDGAAAAARAQSKPKASRPAMKAMESGKSEKMSAPSRRVCVFFIAKTATRHSMISVPTVSAVYLQREERVCGEERGVW